MKGGEGTERTKLLREPRSFGPGLAPNSYFPQGVSVSLFICACFVLWIAEKPCVTVGAIDDDFFGNSWHSQIF